MGVEIMASVDIEFEIFRIVKDFHPFRTGQASTSWYTTTLHPSFRINRTQTKVWDVAGKPETPSELSVLSLRSFASQTGLPVVPAVLSCPYWWNGQSVSPDLNLSIQGRISVSALRMRVVGGFVYGVVCEKVNRDEIEYCRGSSPEKHPFPHAMPRTRRWRPPWITPHSRRSAPLC